MPQWRAEIASIRSGAYLCKIYPYLIKILERLKEDIPPGVGSLMLPILWSSCDGGRFLFGVYKENGYRKLEIFIGYFDMLTYKENGYRKLEKLKKVCWHTVQPGEEDFLLLSGQVEFL